MRLKSAVVFFALVSVGLVAAPSPASAQIKEAMEKSRKVQKKDAKAKEKEVRLPHRKRKPPAKDAAKK